MTRFHRNDTSPIGVWWWTVDRWSVAAIATLMATGALLILAASPPMAERIGFDSLYFVRRQLAFLPAAIALMFAISLLTPRGVRRAAAIGFLGSLLLLIATLFIGVEINGAQRWLGGGGLSVQPSEFIKPTFAVVSAALFARARLTEKISGKILATGLYVIVTVLLLLQPDFGMALVVSVVWFAQFFLAGLPIVWVAVGSVLGIAAIVAGYLSLPHVASRIDRFLDPSSGETYQVSTALEAFNNGGLFGRGPGEGTVKGHIPDAHTDFVFAVAGEEFGLVPCIAIVALFAFVVLRGYARMLREIDLFIVLATAGLLTQFGLQAVINMASSLRLTPTKGMTLPFISYGGSSLFALALAMGMVLAFTRRRVVPGTPL